MAAHLTSSIDDFIADEISNMDVAKLERDEPQEETIEDMIQSELSLLTVADLLKNEPRQQMYKTRYWQHGDTGNDLMNEESIDDMIESELSLHGIHNTTKRQSTEQEAVDENNLKHQSVANPKSHSSSLDDLIDEIDPNARRLVKGASKHSSHTRDHHLKSHTGKRVSLLRSIDLLIEEYERVSSSIIMKEESSDTWGLPENALMQSQSCSGLSHASEDKRMGAFTTESCTVITTDPQDTHLAEDCLQGSLTGGNKLDTMTRNAEWLGLIHNSEGEMQENLISTQLNPVDTQEHVASPGATKHTNTNMDQAFQIKKKHTNRNRLETILLSCSSSSASSHFKKENIPEETESSELPSFNLPTDSGSVDESIESEKNVSRSNAPNRKSWLNKSSDSSSDSRHRSKGKNSKDKKSKSKRPVSSSSTSSTSSSSSSSRSSSSDRRTTKKSKGGKKGTSGKGSKKSAKHKSSTDSSDSTSSLPPSTSSTERERKAKDKKQKAASKPKSEASNPKAKNAASDNSEATEKSGAKQKSATKEPTAAEMDPEQLKKSVLEKGVTLKVTGTLAEQEEKMVEELGKLNAAYEVVTKDVENHSKSLVKHTNPFAGNKFVPGVNIPANKNAWQKISFLRNKLSYLESQKKLMENMKADVVKRLVYIEKAKLKQQHAKAMGEEQKNKPKTGGNDNDPFVTENRQGSVRSAKGADAASKEPDYEEADRRLSHLLETIKKDALLHEQAIKQLKAGARDNELEVSLPATLETLKEKTEFLVAKVKEFKKIEQTAVKQRKAVGRKMKTQKKQAIEKKGTDEHQEENTKLEAARLKIFGAEKPGKDERPPSQQSNRKEETEDKYAKFEISESSEPRTDKLELKGSQKPKKLQKGENVTSAADNFTVGNKKVIKEDISPDSSEQNQSLKQGKAQSETVKKSAAKKPTKDDSEEEHTAEDDSNYKDSHKEHKKKKESKHTSKQSEKSKKKQTNKDSTDSQSDSTAQTKKKKIRTKKEETEESETNDEEEDKKPRHVPLKEEKPMPPTKKHFLFSDSDSESSTKSKKTKGKKTEAERVMEEVLGERDEAKKAKPEIPAALMKPRTAKWGLDSSSDYIPDKHEQPGKGHKNADTNDKTSKPDKKQDMYGENTHHKEATPSPQRKMIEHSGAPQKQLGMYGEISSSSYSDSQPTDKHGRASHHPPNDSPSNKQYDPMQTQQDKGYSESMQKNQDMPHHKAPLLVKDMFGEHVSSSHSDTPMQQQHTMGQPASQNNKPGKPQSRGPLMVQGMYGEVSSSSHSDTSMQQQQEMRQAETAQKQGQQQRGGPIMVKGMYGDLSSSSHSDAPMQQQQDVRHSEPMQKNQGQQQRGGPVQQQRGGPVQQQQEMRQAEPSQKEPDQQQRGGPIMVKGMYDDISSSSHSDMPLQQQHEIRHSEHMQKKQGQQQAPMVKGMYGDLSASSHSDMPVPQGQVMRQAESHQSRQSKPQDHAPVQQQQQHELRQSDLRQTKQDQQHGRPLLVTGMYGTVDSSSHSDAPIQHQQEVRQSDTRQKKQGRQKQRMARGMSSDLSSSSSSVPNKHAAIPSAKQSKPQPYPHQKAPPKKIDTFDAMFSSSHSNVDPIAPSKQALFDDSSSRYLAVPTKDENAPAVQESNKEGSKKKISMYGNDTSSSQFNSPASSQNSGMLATSYGSQFETLPEDSVSLNQDKRQHVIQSRPGGNHFETLAEGSSGTPTDSPKNATVISSKPGSTAQNMYGAQPQGVQRSAEHRDMYGSITSSSRSSAGSHKSDAMSSSRDSGLAKSSFGSQFETIPEDGMVQLSVESLHAAQQRELSSPHAQPRGMYDGASSSSQSSTGDYLDKHKRNRQMTKQKGPQEQSKKGISQVTPPSNRKASEFHAGTRGSDGSKVQSVLSSIPTADDYAEDFESASSGSSSGHDSVDAPTQEQDEEPAPYAKTNDSAYRKLVDISREGQVGNVVKPTKKAARGPKMQTPHTRQSRTASSGYDSLNTSAEQQDRQPYARWQPEKEERQKKGSQRMSASSDNDSVRKQTQQQVDQTEMKVKARRKSSNQAKSLKQIQQPDLHAGWEPDQAAMGYAQSPNVSISYENDQFHAEKSPRSSAQQPRQGAQTYRRSPAAMSTAESEFVSTSNEGVIAVPMHLRSRNLMSSESSATGNPYYQVQTARPQPVRAVGVKSQKRKGKKHRRDDTNDQLEEVLAKICQLEDKSSTRRRELDEAKRQLTQLQMCANIAPSGMPYTAETRHQQERLAMMNLLNAAESKLAGTQRTSDGAEKQGSGTTGAVKVPTVSPKSNTTPRAPIQTSEDSRTGEHTSDYQRLIKDKIKSQEDMRSQSEKELNATLAEFRKKRHLLLELQDVIAHPFDFTDHKASLYENEAHKERYGTEPPQKYMPGRGQSLEERITGLKEGNTKLSKLLELDRPSQICLLYKYIGDEIVRLLKLIHREIPGYESMFQSEDLTSPTKLTKGLWAKPTTGGALQQYVAWFYNEVDRLTLSVLSICKDTPVEHLFQSSTLQNTFDPGQSMNAPQYATFNYRSMNSDARNYQSYMYPQYPMGPSSKPFTAPVGTRPGYGPMEYTPTGGYGPMEYIKVTEYGPMNYVRTTEYRPMEFTRPMEYSSYRAGGYGAPGGYGTAPMNYMSPGYGGAMEYNSYGQMGYRPAPPDCRYMNDCPPAAYSRPLDFLRVLEQNAASRPAHIPSSKQRPKTADPKVLTDIKLTTGSEDDCLKVIHTSTLPVTVKQVW